AAVQDMARNARAIAIVADATPGVHWELALLRESGYAAKTLYLLPPAVAATDDARRIMLRELGSTPPGAAAAGVPTGAPVVGWYHNGGTTRVLTDPAPSRSSYVCALRLFFRSQSN